MLDINLIREKPEWVKEQVAKRNAEAPIDQILADDGRRREILQEVEELRRQRNSASKQIGRFMGNLKKKEAELKRTEAGPAADALKAEVKKLAAEAENAKDAPRKIGEQIAVYDEELREVETRLNENLLWVPNLTHESVPIGPDEAHNVFHEPQAHRSRSLILSQSPTGI